MRNIEQELKIALNKTDYETLFNVGKTKPQLQVNYYFYCKGMPADVMLRIRFKNGKYMFCYKRLLSSANGVNVCDERECPLDGNTANKYISKGLLPIDVKKLVDVDFPFECQCAGQLSTYRSKFTVDKWLIELDKNEYLGVTDYELECECASNELLDKLKDRLINNYGIAFKPSLSKSARFFNQLKRR